MCRFVYYYDSIKIYSNLILYDMFFLFSGIVSFSLLFVLGSQDWCSVPSVIAISSRKNSKSCCILLIFFESAYFLVWIVMDCFIVGSTYLLHELYKNTDRLCCNDIMSHFHILYMIVFHLVLKV